MPPNNPRRSVALQLGKKFTVSAFIAGTFAAYAVHDRSTSSNEAASLAPPNEAAFGSTSAPATDAPTASATPILTATSTVTSTAISTLTPTSLPPTWTPIASNTANAPVDTVAPTNTATTVPSSTPVPTQIPTNTPTSIPATATKSGLYTNGQYTGVVADAFYGNVQVKVTITGGRISDVQFLDYPHDRSRSQYINTYAMPYLKTETIKAQSAQVNIISGATLTSQAFVQSLQSALNKAMA